MLPLFDAETRAAVAAATGARVVPRPIPRVPACEGWTRSSGLADVRDEDGSLGDDLLALMHEQKVDHTAAAFERCPS